MATEQLQQASPPRPRNLPPGNRMTRALAATPRAPQDADFRCHSRLRDPDRSDCVLAVFRDLRIHR